MKDDIVEPAKFQRDCTEILYTDKNYCNMHFHVSL